MSGPLANDLARQLFHRGGVPRAADAEACALSGAARDRMIGLPF